MKVTNRTRDTLNFVTGIKDGAAITESLKAGESKQIAIDLTDAQVQGRMLSGAISVEGGDIPLPKTVRVAPSDKRTVPTLGGAATVRD